MFPAHLHVTDIQKKETNVVWLCQCDQRYDDGGNGDYDDYDY